jgi:ribosomal protein S18 acetylase RimI-like enzyme
MSVIVRDVGRGDAQALADVHTRAWLGAYRGLISDAFLDGISAEQWAARWAQRLSGDELPPVRVAVRDGAIVGFCVVATPSCDEDTGDDVSEVVALNVGPDAWRCGVGTALMIDALDRLRRGGRRMVSLWVVDGNDRAQRFYARLGFEFDGTSTVDEEIEATELRMRLSLPAADQR